MAFQVKNKQVGDLILSAEWNEAMEEIARLGDDKVDSEGDTVQGDMAITGKLGVGTTEPDATLHVQGTVRLERNSSDVREPALTVKTSGVDVEGNPVSSSFTIDVAQGSGLTNLVAGARISSKETSYEYSSHRGAARIQFHDGSMTMLTGARTGIAGEPVTWQPRLILHNNGNVAIGEVTPSVPLHIVGGTDAKPNKGGTLQLGKSAGHNLVLDNNEIMARNAGAAATLHLAHHVKVAGDLWAKGTKLASSRVLKQDIASLEYDQAAAALDQLEPVRFRYKSNPEVQNLGFIAEDVPDLMAKDNRTAVSPMDIIAVLTRVVKQQQERIAALEAKLAES